MLPPIITALLSVINFIIFTTVIVLEWRTISKKLPAIPDDKERNRVFHKIQWKLQIYPFLGFLIICLLIWQNKFFQTAHNFAWTIIVASIFLLCLPYCM